MREGLVVCVLGRPEFRALQVWARVQVGYRGASEAGLTGRAARERLPDCDHRSMPLNHVSPR